MGENLCRNVVRIKTLPNSAKKPSFLKRHLVTNYSKEKEQDDSYF